MKRDFIKNWCTRVVACWIVPKNYSKNTLNTHHRDRYIGVLMSSYSSERNTIKTNTDVR